jgi:hypothetical protein
MTLALPVRSRRRPAATARQAKPFFVEEPAPMPKSRLDLVLGRLAHDHPEHGAGPIFPCPLCFDPPLQVAR